MSGRLSWGALGGGTVCPSFPPPAAVPPRCHGDRARPRPRKCLFLLLHRFLPAAQALAGTLGAGSRAGDRSRCPAEAPLPAQPCGWVLSPGDPFPVSRGQTAPFPQAASPLLLLRQELKPELVARGGYTGALGAPRASHSPALVLPVLGAGHSSSQPLTQCPPTPELPGAAQWGAGTSHLRVPEQQQKEEGGGEGLCYRLRESGAGGLGASPSPLAGQCVELPVPPALPRRERGQPQPLCLQLSSAFQGSDADKSEDNLVVDEVSASGCRALGRGWG